MAGQSVLSWSVQAAYIKAYRSFDRQLNDVYVWIEEAITEAKKTFETSEIHLIPKTPSAAKRCTRKKTERDLAAHSRSLRSTYGTRKRDSQDSGVDFEQPRKARTRNQSRLDCDESISQLNSISKSLADETLHSTDCRLPNTTAHNTTLNKTKRLNTKRNIKIQDDNGNQKVDFDRSIFDDESVLQMEEQSKHTGEKLRIKEPNIVEVQERTGKVRNIQDDEIQKVHEDMQENVVHMQSINEKKLSAEFGLKGCSVKLDAASVAVETTASSTTIALQNLKSSVRDNYFPSPRSSTPQVNGVISSTDDTSGSVSAGGRLLNMVKNAVGALLPTVMRRTGSPSTMREVNSPLSAVHESDFAVSANRLTPNNVAQTEQSSKVQSASQSAGRVSKSRRSSNVKVLKGGPRLSLSKRRSSTVGHKARLVESRKSRSLSMNVVPLNDQAVFEQEQARTVTNALEDDARVSDGDIEESDDDDVEIMDTPPQRVTRSKMRPCPKTVFAVPKQVQVEQTAPVLRVTRSKLRVEKPQTLTDSEDDATPTNSTLGFQAPKTPSTVIKAKPLGQKVQQMQKLLCENPSFGLGTQKPKLMSPASSNSSVRRKSSKRAHDDQQTNSASPPKRLCTKQSFFSPAESSRRVQPFGSCQTSKTSEIHSFLKKKPTTGTPVHNNVSSVVTSFLQKNTPKILTREEIFERKRRELEEKNKKMSEMAQKRAELMQKRVEMQRRVREEQYQLVQKRRHELERDIKKVTGNTVTNTNTRLSEDNAPRMATRLQIDDRPKVDQQEKLKLRDRRIAEAEQRRKQEEEAKKQIILQQEREKQAQEELARRRREQEEAERQQRMAEQRRQEEERRARLERERQLELQRQRQLEEQRLREEQEKQRAKEERERREKAEKERQEMERVREKERLKQLEIERQKEMERIRIAEERVRLEAERRMREEQQKTQKVIEKHNSLQKQVSTTNLSQNTANTTKKELAVSVVDIANTAGTKPTPAVSKSQVETTLNRTFSKETTSESYEMTPVAKKMYKSSNLENYDIGDLNSEDSTDEEDKPRKRIPVWAEGTALKVALINQNCHPPNLEQVFGIIDMPDLNEIFVKKRPRFNKRTSSAVWEASILLPKSP